MATISEAMAIAIQHHHAGRLQAAESIYRQILEADPTQADAMHLLGVIAQQVGNYAMAAEYIARAIGLKANVASFHNNLGEVYRASRRTADAVACYRRALELKPGFAEAHNNLGVVLKGLGNRDEAIACYRRAAQLKPDFAEAHYNLANALKDHGDLDQALASYRRALELKPDYAEVHYNLGNALKDQGNLDEATACYYRVLQLKPDYLAAYNNLGAALCAQGKQDEAVACYRRVLEVKPDYAEARYNLGRALREQGNLDEAIACYRRLLELKPDYAEAHNNLGAALNDQGRPDEAVACYRRALELKPDYAEAHNNLGAALREQGQLDQAVACYRRVLELKPDYAEAHNNLGNALQSQKKPDEAIACYRRALELKPDSAEAHNNLGNVLNEQGMPDRAIACFHRALELKPGFAEVYCNLGNALKDQRKQDEAIACYRRALELKPDYAEVYTNLGLALGDQGKLAEALACFRRAVELKPDMTEAHVNLGNTLMQQANHDEALACYHRALELKPDYVETHSNLLLGLHYCPGITPAALAEAHVEYDRQHAAPLRDALAKQDAIPDRDGRLRLGFVSADLGRHPVGYFLVRVLENLSHQQHQIVCYSDGILKDDLTHRMQAAATQWRDVMDLSDQRLAEQIREDRIDVLFDLAGHTARNRLLVFARKPAPIQVTWAGYVGTTGLSAMDYLLADRYEIPPGTERHYRERVLRMPNGYVCYDPPVYAPAVASLPALARGELTLGCVNNPAKISSQVIDVWAKILRRLPQARLLLKFKGGNDCGMVRRFAEMFAARSIDPGRLELLGQSSHVELLAEYNHVDLALDPFPYSGGLTTLEALWMGVPVMTCPGDTFASRHSLSHLSSVGLTDLIARDLDEYVELAVSLAGDLPRLAALRAGLRQRMAASPLCDGKRFAANFASLLQDVWKKEG